MHYDHHDSDKQRHNYVIGRMSERKREDGAQEQHCHHHPIIDLLAEQVKWLISQEVQEQPRDHHHHEHNQQHGVPQQSQE